LLRAIRAGGLRPTTESAFHIAEFASGFRGFLFLASENAFHIAKYCSYPIEK